MQFSCNKSLLEKIIYKELNGVQSPYKTVLHLILNSIAKRDWHGRSYGCVGGHCCNLNSDTAIPVLRLK